jgi:hypothetical protein
MVSAFMAIVTQALSIGMEQLFSPLKKIGFLCVALAVKAGKLSAEVVSFVGFMHCRLGENKPISNCTFLECFVVGAALSDRLPSASRINVTPTLNPLKGMPWNCHAI